MAELKTKKNDASVDAFINSIADEKRREECQMILEMMQEETGDTPVMWGDAIVGFGRYHYVYASGREGDWFLTGFSPRKQNLTLYLTKGIEQHADLLQKLGHHKTGKGCLYINKLGDVDLDVLRELIRGSLADHLQGS